MRPRYPSPVNPIADRSNGRFLAAFSERGLPTPGEASPTARLARELAENLGHPEIPIGRATQVHGNEVLAVERPIAPSEVELQGEGDILATARLSTALVVQTADCVPILLTSPVAVAAVHAGWRGTARGAAATAVEALIRRFGAAPSEIRAFLGPSIGACCYEVGGDVAAQFAGEFARRGCGGKFRLDLKAANRAQLESKGVSPSSIETLPFCTLCGGEKFASYRRDGERAGRMIALVARL